MRMRKILCACSMAALAAMLYAQSTEQLMSIGADQLRSGEYSQAVTSFKRAATRDPGNFEAQFNLALAYLAWGQDQKALDEFKKAAGINPRSSDVWANLGVAYERLGNKAKATESLSKAISLDPGNIDARLNLASMYADMGRSAEALAQFKQILAVDGRNITALINAARITASKKNVAEAKNYLREAMVADPQNAEVHWEMGNILSKYDKNLDEAVSAYRRAVSIEPSSQVFYDELGSTLEALGKKKEALDVYRTYCAYLSDAIKKEEIEKRISRLENSEAASSASEARAEEAPAHDVETLKRQVRGESGLENGAQRMRVDQSASDILGDLNDLTSGMDDRGQMDLKAEAKKKSQEKKK